MRGDGGGVKRYRTETTITVTFDMEVEAELASDAYNVALKDAVGRVTVSGWTAKNINVEAEVDVYEVSPCGCCEELVTVEAV